MEAAKSVDDLFRAGDLRGAIELQTKGVKQHPADADARYHLVVLLCFAGELERADKQLAVLADQDSRMRTGSLVLNSLLAAEFERRRVFEREGRPTLPDDAPPWARLRVEALEKLRAGDTAGAAERVDAAVAETPSFAGRLDGRPFGDLRDYDDLLSSVLEVFAGGRYLWLPFSRIARLELHEAKTAIDTLWRPARLQDREGTSADVHLPVLYAPSYAHENDAVRLGRLTDWRERGELYTGVGQHVFVAVRGGERFEESLLSVRELELDAAG